MRLDFCRMTSTSGGTGTLTLTAQPGYPDVAEAFTGTIFVEYSAVEYTSSAKTQLSKAETGIGSIVTSTGVLTRTKVLSTWDGTDYRPKFGTATAPTAINFGTTSANIDIMVLPMAGGILPPLPFIPGAVASVADGYGVAALNLGNIGGLSVTATTGQVVYFPVQIAHQGPFSQVAIRQVNATTGGSPTVDIALYEIGSDGLPGKQLIAFTQIAVGAANTNYQSTALATPVYLVPGWYMCAYLWKVGGGSGGTFRGVNINGGCDGYTLLANSTSATSAGTLGSQTALADPATAATGNLNASTLMAMFFK